MKLLIDAQLPRRLAKWLNDQGWDARHTLDLPSGNRTGDRAICRVAEQEDRIVVTKDDDFVQSFLLNETPPRLLLITAGNIDNAELIALVQDNLDAIQRAFLGARFVELQRQALFVHE